MNLKETNADKLIEKAVVKLKGMKEFDPPEWSRFVKTGTHKQRQPDQPDWWYIRTASILRRISIDGGSGVSRLRKDYGGRKNRGHKPEKKVRASGSVIRKIMQQLEAAEFVQKEKGKGRVISPKGQAFLNEIAKGSKVKSL